MTRDIELLTAITNKLFGTDYELKHLQSLPLYNKQPRNSFEKYLLENRLHDFLRLKILFHIGFDKQFAVGHENVEYCNRYSYDTEEADYTDIVNVGPTMINKTFSGEELFERMLGQFCFRTLVLKHPVELECSERHGLEQSTKMDTNEWDESAQGEVFFCISEGLPLIIAQDTIYFAAGNTHVIKEMLQYHHQLFEDFLDEYHNSGGVPHQVYVNWLVTWFPGIIKTRTLS